MTSGFKPVYLCKVVVLGLWGFRHLPHQLAPQLQDQLLGRRTGTDKDDDFDQCLAGQTHPDMPDGKATFKQKEWNKLSVQEEYSQLLAAPANYYVTTT